MTCIRRDDISAERGIYWEDKERNKMGKIISSKMQKKFFQWMRKGRKREGKGKLTLFTLSLRKE